MTYLFANQTTYICIPFYNNVDVSAIRFALTDKCFEYPISVSNIEKCNGSLRANVTLSNFDTKRYSLSVFVNDVLITTVGAIVQKSKGELPTPILALKTRVEKENTKLVAKILGANENGITEVTETYFVWTQNYSSNQWVIPVTVPYVEFSNAKYQGVRIDEKPHLISVIENNGEIVLKFAQAFTGQALVRLV